MKTLILFTHPTRNSFNGALLERVTSILKGKNKNNLRVTDLYAEGFNPVLVFDETHKRTEMQFVPELEKYRQDLLWAEHIIFMYPLWWGRPPAMLLGYIDRVIASGFAYRYEKPDSAFPVGLLGGKKVTCISTMKGPGFYPLLFLYNAHKVLMKKAIFNFIGIKKVKFLQFGNVEKSGKKRAGILERLTRYCEKNL